MTREEKRNRKMESIGRIKRESRTADTVVSSIGPINFHQFHSIVCHFLSQSSFCCCCFVFSSPDLDIFNAGKTRRFGPSIAGSKSRQEPADGGLGPRRFRPFPPATDWNLRGEGRGE